MKSLTRLLSIIGAALGLSFGASQANAVPVDLELVLAVDVSTSVDDDEFDLQKQGYVDAFNNAAIANAINQGAIGSIAVTLVYWASAQEQAVNWFLIDGSAGNEASDFADAIDATSRPSDSNPPAGVGCCTGIGDAISFSDGLFGGNGFEGTRNIIDVSGDGTNNTGGSVTAARDNALGGTGNTDVINGLPIGGNFLLNYYENNVIGGPGAFAILSNDFESFGEAIDDKLIREISQVPEPGTLVLLAVGLLLLGGFASRSMRFSTAA